MRRPQKIVMAIPGLPIYNDMFCCGKCGYAALSRDQMSRHKHQRSGSHYSSGTAQTFLPSSKKGFFGVTLPKGPEPGSYNPARLFEEQFS